ncbi:MAG: DUF4272 domain-containing protein [Lachnospiraceae bacterium]|nr:DUF4272 domain-containing protein [Lachnospiraceae bacterium]
MEINQIYNRGLKEQMGNYAISILLGQDLIAKEELKYLSMSVGYMFTTEEGELEALFKVMCSEKSFAFAAQKGQMMLLNISEQQYAETVNYMVGYHDCLKNHEPVETEAQKNRRMKNCEYLRQNGIKPCDKLVCGYEDNEVRIKGLEEICRRAVACLITVQIACDINQEEVNQGDYQESLSYFVPMLKQYGVEDCLNSKEKRIVDGSYSEQDAIDMDWAYEAYWALCWCLGLVDDIKDGGELCDCDAAISFVREAETFEAFMGKCKLRSVSEILDMQDLYFRYNWAINDRKVHANTEVGNLDASNVIERRRALEWILSEEEDWYDITMHA